MASDVNSLLMSPSDLIEDLFDLSRQPITGNEPDGKVDTRYTLNGTCRPYSPQSSQFVRVFTEMSTPSQQNVNNETDSDIAQYSQSSEINTNIPNQEFIAMLDRDLLDLPRDSYISKLKELTHDNDDTITWYRNTLASRARSIEGCPLGKLFTRKSTNKSSSTLKYARDCYMLYMFIRGDQSGIDEIFRKEELKSVSDQNGASNCQLVELRVTLQSILHRLNDVESSEKQNVKIIDGLRKENEKLKCELAKIKGDFEHHIEISDRKSTQTEAKLKLITQQTKSIGEFDFNVYNENIKQIQTELDRHSKIYSCLQKNITDLKLNSLQTYASKVNPQVAPVSVSTTDRVSTSSDTIHCINPLNTPTHSPVSDQRDSGLYERSNPKLNNTEKYDGPERRQSEMCDTNLSQEITYRIPVRLKGETENLVTTNDDFFTGVTKKRTARYYISGIDPKSTRSGIITYLEQRDVHVTFLRLFNTKHNSYRIAAKLNVSESSASTVESHNFWPSGISCRKWVSNREWNQRFSEDYNQHYSDESVN